MTHYLHTKKNVALTKRWREGGWVGVGGKISVSKKKKKKNVDTIQNQRKPPSALFFIAFVQFFSLRWGFPGHCTKVHCSREGFVFQLLIQS